MAAENKEGGNPDMKIRIEYFENDAKFHMFGEHNCK